MTDKVIPNLNGRSAIVFCDFDGTVTLSDVTDVLLEKLADPEWTKIEQRWLDGEIDDCECMAQQIALIRGDWHKIAGIIDGISIDPHFRSFIDICKKANIPIYIGSNGLDRVIMYILDRENIEVDGYWAYRLLNKQGWSLEFPMNEKRGDCQAANSIACKCALVEKKALEAQVKQNNLYKIVIGDSRSDFCWAHKADFVFAKSKLAKYCLERNIPHISFSDFSQVNQELERII